MTFDINAVLDAAPVAERFFDGFEEHTVAVNGSSVFYRIGGDGPPLLLLHGYPQTSAMWHRVAPELARHYTVICPDLRGYGRSAKPETDADHSPYAKRAMAGDLIALLDHLGHDRVRIGAHDRGARVAHRLAYDHPDRVSALSILDIAPTREMYREGDSDFARTYWHWYWLVLDAPFPEKLIGADPAYFWCKKCFDGSAGATPFARQAIVEYLAGFDTAGIHASCEDYRAAWSIDIKHDDAEAGKVQVPMQALWGANGAIEAHFDALALWRERVENVTGHSLPGGHYLAEESPQAVLDAWLPFFAEQRD